MNFNFKKIINKSNKKTLRKFISSLMFFNILGFNTLSNQNTTSLNTKLNSDFNLNKTPCVACEDFNLSTDSIQGTGFDQFIVKSATLTKESLGRHDNVSKTTFSVPKNVTKIDMCDAMTTASKHHGSLWPENHYRYNFTINNISLKNATNLIELSDWCFIGFYDAYHSDVKDNEPNPFGLEYTNRFISSASIPSSLQRIGKHVFSYSNITNLNWEDAENISVIDDYAFANCKKLSQDVFIKGANFDSVNNSAFKNSSIKSFNAPFLRNIGNNAFEDCSNLKKVFLSNIKTIGQNAFANDNNIEWIVFGDKTPPKFSNNWLTNNTKVKIIVPKGQKETFLNAQNFNIPEDRMFELDFENSFFVQPKTFGDVSVFFAEEQFDQNATGEILFFNESNKKGSTLTTTSQVKSIFQYAFEDMKSLSKIDLSQSQNILINKGAFKNATNPNKEVDIVFPSKSGPIICENAFEGDKINNIYFNSLPNKFGNNWNPKSVNTIYVPKNSIDIFSNTQNFGYDISKLMVIDSIWAGDVQIQLDQTKTKILSWSYGKGKLVVPENIVEISEGAFANNNLITDVDFSQAKKLKKISDSAFYNCKFNNSSLILPSSLEEISHLAFSYLKGVKFITFSNENTTSQLMIDSQAFSYSADLKIFIFPTNIQKINEFAFYNDKLEIIYFLGKNVPTFEQNWQPEIDTKNIFVPKNSIDSFNNSQNFGFVLNLNNERDCDYISLEKCGDIEVLLGIKNNLYNILKYVSGQGTLVIPYSVGTIDDSAFEHCCNIFSLDLSNATNLNSIGFNAFSDCENLTGDLVIPSSVTSIGDYAFQYSKITSLDLSNAQNLNIIGNSSFSGCNDLSGQIYIPKNLTKIGSWAFKFCKNINSIKVDESNKAFSLANNLGSNAYVLMSGTEGVWKDESHVVGYLAVGELSIPNTITKISDFEFQGTSITSLDLSHATSLKTIGNYAFNNCVNLNSNILIPESLEKIGDYAFAQTKGKLSTSIISSNLHSELSYIGDGAFENTNNTEPGNELEFYTRKELFIGKKAFANAGTFKNIIFFEVQSLKLSEESFANTNVEIMHFIMNNKPEFGKKWYGHFKGIGFETQDVLNESLKDPNFGYSEKFVFVEGSY